MPLVDLSPWERVKERYEAGQFVPLHVREMAEEALGKTFVRPPRRARTATAPRPDYRDRQAGDDTYGDDDGGMVAL